MTAPCPACQMASKLCILTTPLAPPAKVLPASRAYKGQDVNILFCDDNRIFLPRWAETLLKAAQGHPGCAAAISMIMLNEEGAENYKPKFFPRAVINRRTRDIPYRLRRIWSQLDVFGLHTSPHKPARYTLKSFGHADIAEGVNGISFAQSSLTT